ncbi:MAG: MBL fold metallo-hydrolase [Candidatus Colwellbacteria bacterium]|nr:MBL fold metallo-hydrolase [Candidatus Colwellbacteria bacterium]
MKYLSLSFLVLIGFNLFVWYYVAAARDEKLDLYFLDVGQGDSELLVLPGGAKVLIDGGPGKEVLFELARVLRPTDRYIDLVILTHPQLDHYGGLYDVAERYRIGAIIWNGREGQGKEWQDFWNLVKSKEIPVITLGAKDKIRYGENLISVLSPTNQLRNSSELNNSSLVLELEAEGAQILFTGDAGFEVENYLTEHYDLDADILKVGHHGSRTATGLKFLAETTPKIGVIEVGENNPYGHPTSAVLSRLASVGSRVYRTDENGTVHLIINDGIVGVGRE